jgi:hypothetical protein
MIAFCWLPKVYPTPIYGKDAAPFRFRLLYFLPLLTLMVPS